MNSFTMKMKILLEPTSNKLMVERFNTSAGNPVRRNLLTLNLFDHMSILMDLKKSQVHKMAKFQDGKEIVLVDDLKMLPRSHANTSSRNKLNPEINDYYNIVTGECQKDELKTQDKALYARLKDL
ncbi:hypothetical protein Tco_1474171 [Tanacetum coccineum]